ncbi:hypothetical protein GFV13_09795 [Leuconostoc mesenteroides]|uniref:Uncharacterized protein n=1 Tax=Leuconostoc mesenteroides TaxID=1245 RepID=A0A843YYC8_LEUME|nr:hypothetical protein [Leuconostoc mesenteroides]MQR27522.1 hypothetical protein [Leuconostoc mesenteroides]
MNWFVKLMISIGITIAGWCAIDIVFQLLDGGTLSTSFWFDVVCCVVFMASYLIFLQVSRKKHA